MYNVMNILITTKKYFMPLLEFSPTKKFAQNEYVGDNSNMGEHIYLIM